MQPTVWYKSKTLGFNAILILVSALTLATTSFELSPELLKGIMFVIGVLNIINRIVSKDSSDITLSK